MKLRGKLYPGEQTIILTRAHPGALVGTFVYLLVAFTSASFASTARSSGLLFWAGSVVAAVTALVALRKIWRWSVTRYAITTHRIMIIKGLMRRKADLTVWEIVGFRRVAWALGWGTDLSMLIMQEGFGTSLCTFQTPNGSGILSSMPGRTTIRYVLVMFRV